MISFAGLLRCAGFWQACSRVSGKGRKDLRAGKVIHVLPRPTTDSHPVHPSFLLHLHRPVLTWGSATGRLEIRVDRGRPMHQIGTVHSVEVQIGIGSHGLSVPFMVPFPRHTGVHPFRQGKGVFRSGDHGLQAVGSQTYSHYPIPRVD